MRMRQAPPILWKGGGRVHTTKPKSIGYPVDDGWLGQMPDGTWRLFSTENEYEEAFADASSSEAN